MSTYEITDSILKRHHQQLTGDMPTGTIGGYPITDSIQRRHDAQHRSSGGGNAGAADTASMATNAKAPGVATAGENRASAGESTDVPSSSPFMAIFIAIALLVAGYFILKYFKGN